MSTITGTASASVDIEAPAELVYDLVSDVARMGEWSPECTGADRTEPLAPGATFTGHNRRGDQAWSTSCTVVAAEPGRLFSFAAGDPDSATTWSYELRATSPGRTLVTESFDSVALRDPAVAAELQGRTDQLAADLHTTLAALKAVAEREHDR